MKHELHFFWLWPSARYAEQEAIHRISDQFRIVATVTIDWPPDASNRSFNRIYARNLWNSWSREMSAGSGTSLMVIVKDVEPKYGLEASASGVLAVVNKKMVAVKQELRQMTSRHYPYAVHSSTTRNEFLRDARLALPVEDFNRIINHSNSPVAIEPMNVIVDGPLIGHHGWKSWGEFFSSLSHIEEFCRLSSAESLSNDAQTGDVDMLCRSIWSFAASANAMLQVEGSRKPRFIVRIGDVDRLLDLREPGDGDLPVAWQERILRERQFGRLGPELSGFDWVAYRLYRLVCQKDFSASVGHEIQALLSGIGFNLSASPVEDGASAVAGYCVGSGIPLTGVDSEGLVNQYGWTLLQNQYWSTIEDAEPTWKWRP